MTVQPMNSADLLIDIRQLIDSARQRVALAVNAELTLLYWQVGQRIQVEVLQGERAAYGLAVVKTLASRLMAEYGKGWSEQQLRHCLRVAETFPDEAILSALRQGVDLHRGRAEAGFLHRDVSFGALVVTPVAGADEFDVVRA